MDEYKNQKKNFEKYFKNHQKRIFKNHLKLFTQSGCFSLSLLLIRKGEKDVFDNIFETAAADNDQV